MVREKRERGEEGREDQSSTEKGGVVMTYRHNWFTLYVPDHVRNILC